MTPEQIDAFNTKNWKQNDKDWKAFKELLAKGVCWVCSERLESFDDTKPCAHWLLMPPGFRKRHLKILFEARTIDKIEGFLRWYVNAHTPIKNINDLKDEHGGNTVKDLTIRHGNLEWSISCSKGCFEGNHGIHGSHYHFQMRVDGKRFHDYSDRHIKLSEFEQWLINVELGKHPKIKRLERHGAGMQDMFDNVEPELLLSSLRSTDDPDNATFHISSMVMADEGHTISGDDFADLVEENKRTGIPHHQLVKKLKHVKTTVFVEPGDGVPEAAKRTQRNRGKKKR